MTNLEKLKTTLRNKPGTGTQHGIALTGNDVELLISTLDDNTGGWATTGTTTLTGDVIIEPGDSLTFNGATTIDGNLDVYENFEVDGQTIFNGDVVIMNSVSDTEAFYVHSDLNAETSILRALNQTDDSNVAQLYLATTDTSVASYLTADFNDGTKIAEIQLSANESESTIILRCNNGIDADAAIPSYANNAAALAAIGAGKLYYTDVAGEYLIKMSH